MNIKQQQTHNYQQLNLKNKNQNKLSKQPEQEQSHWYRDHLEGYQLGGGSGRMGEMTKKQGSRSIIGRNNTDGEVKNSIGKEEAEELTHTTHVHELREEGHCWREGRCWGGRRAGKGRKIGTTITA